ncbi:allergen Tha p 1-like [Venturia canescens]|uniref:allergen Tha p 1-like n=1 Tax=Venturia canescens TaxID=32260 RepID=UPI001C9CC78D|nr:allergen Tha p 1-like [Venturia canescens]
MKFCLLLMALVASAFAAETHSNKFDNVDIDSILGNKRILTNYIKCMLDEGNCTPDGRDFKKLLPEVLGNGCNKCTERQKSTAEKVIKHLKRERAADWNRLLKKYDPKGEYEKRYQATLNA